MTKLSDDFNQFFKELAANNHKEWFDQNRKRYENNVKKPFEDFVAAVISEIQKTEPELKVEPKKAIFRINRDIRFSKDKSPYKLNRSAAISNTGKKDGANAGLYLQLGPENVAIGGGSYQPDKEQLLAIREHIKAHPIKFRAAIDDERFRETYGDLQGEKNKRIPPEFTEAAVKEPLLYNKQFYYMAEFPPEIVTDPLLVEFVAEKYNDSRKFREFISEALQA